MFEEEEDCNCAGRVILKEQLAQIIHENKRLKEELHSLKRNSFGIEEHLNLLSDDFKKKDSDLKRSEQTVDSLLKVIQEKDEINDVLEREMEELKKANKKLEISIVEVKNEKDELIEQNEVLLSKEKELKEKHNSIEMELSDLVWKFNSLREKDASYGLLLDDLRQQVKVLEDEKIALQKKFFDEKCGIGSPLPKSQYFHFDFDSPPAQRRLDFSLQKDHNLFDTECNHLNLKEELLLAKIQKKQFTVESLEEKLNNSERTVEQLSRILQERLREAITVIIVLWKNAGGDFELIFPPLKSDLEKLIDVCKIWSDGQVGEKNPLTEGPDTIREKEIIINEQPAPNRTIEYTTIATQTDRILLARAFEDFGPIHNVLDHKYNDVDMDLYRSCRKLSVLPEEEDDDTFKRIPSLKNTIYNNKPRSAKLPETYKIHSADDILNFEKSNVKVPSSQKLMSSCTNIIFSSPGNVLNDSIQHTEFFESSPKNGGGFPTICDNELSDNNNVKSEQKSIDNSNQSQLGPLDPLEALRQPHSFDSYLDPQQVPTTPLPRQISDPIQNTTFDPPLTRRGSYLKRPRSTCRPLRLPCEENAVNREERVSKVRFDLSSNVNSKSVDNMNGSKGPIPASNLKNHRKIEKISRFTVERVDEDEFRKSIEESNKTKNRKRPPLIHSVVYKKSVLHDITFYDPESSVSSAEGFMSKGSFAVSSDSPYETATENSPADSFEMANYEGNYLMADVYSTKKRKQSDSSNYSVESQDSIDGNNIFIKSIRLHTTGEYITMKELDRDSSNSSHFSADTDIPYIDAEELPVIKPSPEVFRRNLTEQNDDDLDIKDSNERSDYVDSGSHENNSAINQSDSSETFVTACSDMTPISDMPEMCLLPPKSTGLSKSPTVLKNLSNFELYNTVSESITVLNQNRKASVPVRNQTVEEEDESFINENPDRLDEDREEEEEESTILKLTSSDGSEMSDVTYVTVKSDPSNVLLSSDCDSDTYVTVQSDKSALERKFSDLSENSSSPYNTPPDTSSASFCTPPDTYSPILSRIAKRLSGEGDPPRSQTRSSSPYKYIDQTTYSEYHALCSPASLHDSTSFSSPFKRKLSIQSQEPENEPVAIQNTDDPNFPSERTEAKERRDSIIFDSPKLEFYETNDSIENLEAFLNTEEELQDVVKTSLIGERSWKFSTLEDLQEEPSISEGLDFKNSDMEEGFILKSNSGESQSGTDSKFFEKRNKRHPPLSRQNSTEEYNFLEPHDSCLNLSEEISSPSTTPDTSNKTVVFKNKPLTMSNTIDLEDDDFPISDSEIHINFNGSETEIVEVPLRDRVLYSERRDIYSSRSEPCIPSISSSELPRLPKQSSSMTEDKSVEPGSPKFEGNILTMPPEIVVSNLSFESNNNSDDYIANLPDFASNVSERSEINLSDLNSISMHSDNECSNCDLSDNLPSAESPELQLTDREISLSLSPEVSDNTSNSSSELLVEVLDLEEPEIAGAGNTNREEESEQLYIDVHEPITYGNLENIKFPDLPEDEEFDESEIRGKYSSEASSVYKLRCEMSISLVHAECCGCGMKSIWSKILEHR